VQALQLNLAEVEDPIRNRVSESGLIQLELSELITVNCVELDFTDWLHEGLVLIEKDFRDSVDALDVEQFNGKGVGIKISGDAIVPEWAWMVITARIEGAAFVVVGGIDGARNEALRRGIESIDLEEYRDKRVIVRGCDKASGPEGLLLFQTKLQPIVKSIMFGEACSTVPVFKKK
jgi:hypothetical protein